MLSRTKCADRSPKWHEHYFSPSSLTGRVFNDITGLKRESRAAVRLYGEPLGHVDIRCAQPALLALWMSGKIPPNVPKCRETYKHACSCLPCPCLCLPSYPSLFCSSDFDAFVSLACGGSLYEAIVEATGLERDVVKLGLLRDVLAKRGRYPSVVESVFGEQFPMSTE